MSLETDKPKLEASRDTQQESTRCKEEPRDPEQHHLEVRLALRSQAKHDADNGANDRQNDALDWPQADHLILLAADGKR